jgi:hypothetical protein
MFVLHTLWEHGTDKAKSQTSQPNTELMFILVPGGMTSQLQAHKPFKDCMCHLCGKWLLSENSLLTAAWEIKKPFEALHGLRNG